MNYQATPADIENINDLRQRFQLLFGEQLSFEPLIEGADPTDWMHQGHIKAEVTEKRGIDLAIYQYGAYHLTISVFKPNEEKPVCYVIKFFRHIKRRGYRQRTWTDHEGSKIWVSGKDANMAWANFESRFAYREYNAENLGARPDTLMYRYNETVISRENSNA